jgi:FAD/FMN-containing dehydrogenase
MTVGLTLRPDGQVEGQSVSGNVNLNFAAAPSAEIDVQSFSGDIKNCFGPKPVEQHYGPGSRLQFTNGEGHARVRIITKSGDIRLCVKGMIAGGAGSKHSAGLSLAQLRSIRMVVPYVYSGRPSAYAYVSW